MREDDKCFHALLVPWALIKYVLHQAHDALGDNRTVKNIQCLKQLYYWKGLQKDIDAHVKQCLQCRQQNLHPNIMYNYM